MADSPTLVARARQLVTDLQRRVTQCLQAADFTGDAALTAAFIVAGYTSIFIETATDLVAGSPRETLTEQHRLRIRRLLDHLQGGVV